ncbi:MBL fold metallo-hydrolase [Sulfurovum lithotrophicum]|uniref:MBL fold metallo-hydrolase n=1 Tax=Sulfurovum lithotrophicum TaxID=206403 RepID=UPI000697D266|nr:MBL fold metallo-hydrolase [Sulfurovum lithotrophicum]
MKLGFLVDLNLCMGCKGCEVACKVENEVPLGSWRLRVKYIDIMISQPVKAAHTKGDLIVFLKGQKVLFVGDLVFSGRITSLRDGSLVGSLEALDMIDAYGAKVIVGGHGYETDATVTEHFRSYLQEMKKEVQYALDEDVGMEDITKKVTMPQYKNMKLYDVLHARNVLDAYKELEMIEDEE